MKKFWAGLALLCSLSAAHAGERAVYFVTPADGATVSSPFTVKFGLKGMTVKPAGEVVEGTGHHHLLINRPSLPAGEPVPFDEQDLHFGKGQTETEVKLPPGDYTLTLQFANGAHQSYGSALSQMIRVTVK